MSRDMISRGGEVAINNQIKLDPFHSDLYVVWNRDDLNCLMAFLGQFASLSTEFTNPVNNNWQLLKHRPGNEVSSNVIWLPIMERMYTGEMMLGILTRAQVYITDVCMDVCKTAGYDPTKGDVTFSHLVAKAFFDLSVRLGTYLDGAKLVYSTSDQRYLMQNLNKQQWNDITQLSGLALHSAARTMHQQIQHGKVEPTQQGWSATSYLT